MVCYLTAYLFYVMAVIANKHRNLVAKCVFALIGISFISEICCIFETWDMRVVHPPFEPWVEINIAFCRIHAVIAVLLFYYHQRVSGVDVEGDKLSGEESDEVVLP